MMWKPAPMGGGATTRMLLADQLHEVVVPPAVDHARCLLASLEDQPLLHARSDEHGKGPLGKMHQMVL